MSQHTDYRGPREKKNLFNKSPLLSPWTLTTALVFMPSTSSRLHSLLGCSFVCPAHCCSLPSFDYYLHLSWVSLNLKDFKGFSGLLRLSLFASTWYSVFFSVCCSDSGHTLHSPTIFDTSSRQSQLPSPLAPHSTAVLCSFLWPVCEYICCWYLLSPTEHETKT